MSIKKCQVILVLITTLFVVISCASHKSPHGKEQVSTIKNNDTIPSLPAQARKPTQLPVRYQDPTYMADRSNAEEDLGEGNGAEEYQIKMGATIRSTGGPQPLWDVMKRLANLKNMTVSWASDVDQNTLVDVDISADDNFFDAIENLLRQADYIHEVQGKTIIVKYKDTKTYQIGIPFMKGGYTTNIGGNYLTSHADKSTGTEGTVKITSTENKFDIWDNIRQNLDVIIDAYTFIKKEKLTLLEADTTSSNGGNTNQQGDQIIKARPKNAEARKDTKPSSVAYYTIDQSIGLISVTAPKPLLDKIDVYIDHLKKEIYRQVSLEAKIIEVYLQDNSKIGLDWSSILKNFSINGIATFGNSGQVYPSDGSHFISRVNLGPSTFNILLNALNEQGDAHVLANPKLTVLNGQPALISIGKDIAYIKTVTKDVDSDNNETSYTTEVDNVVEGIALGVMASIIDDKKVILHLTPITTELVDGEIQYRVFGDEGLEVGLPQVSIRQMSTMVEVQNGEMLVIGGLIDNVTRNTGNFAPIVGNIPVIKYLFGAEEKISERRELVILLNPKIL